MMKRLLDIIAALFGLLLLLPLLPFVALWIKLDSSGPVFFRQERIGKNFRMFQILKFRTMVAEAASVGGPITVGNDRRITRAGKFLRKLKIDELPQLVNVLIGDMSLVGPRPEVREFVELFQEDYVEILKVRPGVTDLASLKYHDEASVLGREIDPEVAYRTRVLPEKIWLAKAYIRNASFGFDVKLILKTLLKLFDLAKAN